MSTEPPQSPSPQAPVIRTDILVVGAGPVGLFTVFEAGLLGLKCHLVDNLDRVGGQCIELYPDKPIYDIPGVPVQTAQQHVDALLKQISPFDYGLTLGERVDSLTPVQPDHNTTPVTPPPHTNHPDHNISAQRPPQQTKQPDHNDSTESPQVEPKKPDNASVHRTSPVHANPRPQDQRSTPAPAHDWLATTSAGTRIQARNVFIAAGAGAFEPRRPTGIDNPDHLLGKGVSYAVRDRSLYRGKRVFIFGGGDSALDWTVELAGEAEALALVHRRDAFRGAPATEAEMRALVAEGRVQLLTPWLIDGILGEQRVEGVRLRNFDSGERVEHGCDELLFLFGLNTKLGPIADWNLDLADKKIPVDPERFQTSSEGIFAVGDIGTYPGKMDLILCGFHETTLACQAAYRRVHPGERVPFGYTTSNRRLHKALGVGGS